MNEQSLFLAALEQSTAADRSTYLDEACVGDALLRRKVEELLDAHEQAGDFLEPFISGVTPIPSWSSGEEESIEESAPIAEGPGTFIGPYQLREQLGEGGFGVVFLAEQHRPVRRMAALKVIKPGMDTHQVVARFEAERQALALMDHPNIAHVLDAGQTASGRPYFVMELVRGVPITDFCDEHHFTVRQRLALFISVCQAVAHAHQKGIIHRDIKPTNVLVTRRDEAPVVKVIDFGIAKALGPPLTDKTLVTHAAHVVGTPLYMSPEQMELGGLAVDTRTDIYALGVLLYELVTGTTPFDRVRLGNVAFDEMRRIIREEEPARPSTRFTTVVNAVTTASANRQSDPRRLCRLLRGEPDWIVMKCLEKDRARRYETASDLARDLERYLHGQPVEACPPSTAYRLRKFARRHWRVLTAAAAFVLLLVTAVVTLTITLMAVDRERQEKEAALEAEGKRRKQARAALDAMSSNIIEDLLAMQATLLPEHKQFLEQALRSYEEFAADTGQQQEARAGAAHAAWRVGYIRERLGQRQDAEAAWERSRELYAGLVADYPRVPAYRLGLAKTQLGLGVLFVATGRARETEAALGKGMTIYRELIADFPDVSAHRGDLGQYLNNLGNLLKNIGRAREAEEVYGQAVAIYKQMISEFPAEPEFHSELAKTYTNLGNLFQSAHRPREAEESHKRAVAINQQLATDFPTVPRYRNSLAASRNNLGNILRDEGQHPEAEEVFRATLTIRKQLVAEFPVVPVYQQGLAMTLNNMGILFKDTGRPREAEELYRQALAIHKHLASEYPEVPDHQNELAGAMVNLARLLLARQDPGGSRRLLEEALPYHQAALKANPDHPAYRRFYRNNRWRLTETLLDLKDHAAAAVAAAEFLQSAVEPPRDAYTTACLLAGCVHWAARDERLSAVNRQELSSTYGDRALAALHLAVERRAQEVAQMKTDPSLDPLRSRADFQRLLDGLQAVSKP